MTVNVEAPNNDPNYVRASQFVQGNLEAVGINVNLLNPAYSTADTDWTSNNFQFLLFPNNYAPTPFRWMRNPFNIPGWTNSTFKTVFQQSLTETNATTSLALVKQAELIMAQAAVLNSIVILPQYVAFNTAYTNWQPALSNAPSYSVFWDPITAENVLTTVSYPGATSITSTTSSSSSTSTTTTTTSSSSTTSSSATQTSTSSSSSTTSTSSSKSSTGIAYPSIGLVITAVTLALASIAFLSLRRKDERSRAP